MKESSWRARPLISIGAVFHEFGSNVALEDTAYISGTLLFVGGGQLA